MTYCTMCANSGRRWSFISREWVECACPTGASLARRPYAKPAVVETRPVSMTDITREYLAACEENELTISEYEASIAERILDGLINGDSELAED